MNRSEIMHSLMGTGKISNKLKIVLTSKCNLGCSYCPQDHSSQYYREWSLDSLTKTVYSYISASKNLDKSLDFIGGEPLLKRRLLTEFLSKNKQKLIMEDVSINLTTNGLLLTNELIDLIREFPNSAIFTSIDTLATKGLRPLTRDQLELVCSNLSKISSKFGKYNTTVTMSVIPKDILYLKDSLELLSKIGVGNFLINPIFFNDNSPIVWKLQDFKLCEKLIAEFYDHHPDSAITFGAEVAPKGSHNCLKASLISNIDPEGDITGCFFFNGNKAAYPETIIANTDSGNISKFTMEDSELIFRQSQDCLMCSSCNIQNLCSMCPAGLKKLFGRYFGPMMMGDFTFCQQVVRSHIFVRDYCSEVSEVRKAIMEKFNN